ncbi:MAG: DUF2950 domain-containing protein [Planctomycetes bacterium]|nr:DUF2950 domain-containing protein [Planctomycetota bacterium]
MKTHRFEILAIVAALAAIGLGAAGCTTIHQETFASPEEAITAMADVANSGDRARAEALLGVPEAEALGSGDETADRRFRLRFQEMLDQKLAFEDRPDGGKVALIGDEAWPFAFPIVRDGDRWRFDGKAGLEELYNRRVGRNEIFTIATLRAYVDAQREYFSQGRDGNPPTYAQKVRSEPGRQDGLYWEAGEGEPQSPLGPLAAQAAVEGYSKDAGTQDGPVPYHGYDYRILTGQGKNAPGGEKSYIDAQGLMTGGFAAIAWPAKYGNSGIMTFQVNAQGIVFQKDLGEKTPRIVETMTVYDPDVTWMPAEE